MDISFLKDFIDFFFPRICLHCRIEKCSVDEFLCDNCFYTLEKINLELSDVKLKSINAGFNNLNNLFSLYLFQKDKPIQTLLHELKYQNKFLIGEILGKRLAKDYFPHLSKLNIDVVIPIPLHKIKKAERGYNQSYYFAKGLSNALKCKLDSKLVIRKKFTVSQTLLSKEERRANMSEAFFINKNIPYKNILLVDDVITTGSTINACAAEIKKHHDVNIFAASIAIV